MTEAQIKHMVDRFLTWRLPESFSPDAGISFTRFGNPGTAIEYENKPIGTNLLTAIEADAMVRHMLDGMPRQSSEALIAELQESCPGHVASDADPKICGRCGIHIDSLRPDDPE